MTVSAKVLTNGCAVKANDDEPVFILLGRDKHAIAAINAWIESREAERGVSDKTISARDRIHEFEQYQNRK